MFKKFLFIILCIFLFCSQSSTIAAVTSEEEGEVSQVENSVDGEDNEVPKNQENSFKKIDQLNETPNSQTEVENEKSNSSNQEQTHNELLNGELNKNTTELEIEKDRQNNDTSEEKQSKDEILSGKNPLEEQLNQKEVDSQNNSSQLRLVGVSLLENATLQIGRTSNTNEEIITLRYSGTGVLNLSLIANTYITFQLPNEIANVITKSNLSATYDVPRLGLLGIVIRNTGTFGENALNIQGNQVVINFRNLLSLNLLSSTNYNFTLTIKLNQLPLTPTGQYQFRAASTDQIVDISVLPSGLATAVIAAPQLSIPRAPILNSPYYTATTMVKGTGEPNAKVIVTINNVEYSGTIGGNGQFSVPVPAYPAGTTITALVDNGHPQKSESASLTVIELPKTPTLNEVFSNDNVVTGTGDPNTRIQLFVEGTTYYAMTDSKGNYSIEVPKQSVGTIITAGTIDEFDTISELVEETVQQASLGFETVPSQLTFKETCISSNPKTILREDDNWTIEVRDTRGPNSNWNLVAMAEDLKTNLPNGNVHTIPDAMVYKNNYGETFSLNENQVVFNGETTEERIIPISWQPSEGPVLELRPSDAYAQQYSTTITWTLEDAP